MTARIGYLAALVGGGRLASREASPANNGEVMLRPPRRAFGVPGFSEAESFLDDPGLVDDSGLVDAPGFFTGVHGSPGDLKAGPDAARLARLQIRVPQQAGQHPRSLAPVTATEISRALHTATHPGEAR
jgi:hypothetical protein